jgi:hypothetical protein
MAIESTHFTEDVLRMVNGGRVPLNRWDLGPLVRLGLLRDTVHLSPGDGRVMMFGSIYKSRAGFIESEVDFIQTSFRQMPLH